MSALRELLRGGRAIAYYPALARATGSIPGALFLQQIAHYEGIDEVDEEGWVEKNETELEKDLAMTPRIQETARRKLDELKLLDIEKRGHPARNHYRVNWSNLELRLQSLQNVVTTKARHQSQQKRVTSDNKSASLYIEEETTEKVQKNKRRTKTHEPKDNSVQQAIATLVDELAKRHAEPPIQKRTKNRYIGEFNDARDSGVKPETLLQAAKWIALRWCRPGAHYKLSVEDAVGDVVAGTAFKDLSNGQKNGQKKTREERDEDNRKWAERGLFANADQVS